MRRRYLKTHFGKVIDDVLLYDLVINTDRLGYDAAAAVIGRAVLDRARTVPAVR